MPQNLDAACFGWQAAADQQSRRWQAAAAAARSQRQPLLRPVLGGAGTFRQRQTAADVGSAASSDVPASRLAAFIAAQVHAGDVLAAASQPDGAPAVQVKLFFVFISCSCAAIFDLI